MTPIVEVKSGMSTTWDSRPAMIEPETMPARATPIGRPIASTEPKAMIRMTMAKPMPSASDDGTSNSANACPPSSIRSPSTSGIAARMSSPIATVSSNDGVGRRLELGVGDPPGVLAAIGDLRLVARVVRAGQRLHVVDLGDLGEERLDHLANLRIVDALSASNTMLPTWPAPWPPNSSSRMSMPRLLSTSGSVKSEL